MVPNLKSESKCGGKKIPPKKKKKSFLKFGNYKKKGSMQILFQNVPF